MEAKGNSFVCRSCGKECRNQNGLSNHINNACKAHGKRVAGSLAGYQEQNPFAKRVRRLPPLVEDSVHQVSSPSVVAGSNNSLSNGSALTETNAPPTQFSQTPPEAAEPSSSTDGEAQPLPEENRDLIRRDGRPVRTRKKTKDTRYRDFVDTTEELGNIDILDRPRTPPPPRQINTNLTVQSVSDGFGLRRLYYEHPSHLPAPPRTALSSPSLHEDATGISAPSSSLTLVESEAPFGLCKNQSEFLLTNWFSRHNRNTVKSFNELVSVLKSPQFKVDDLPSSSSMLSRLSALGSLDAEESLPEWLSASDGWIKSSITISVPFPYHKPVLSQEPHRRFTDHGIKDSFRPKVVKGGPVEFTVDNFYHRSLTGVLRQRLRQKEFQQMHIHPYELRWKPGEDKADVRVYSETYSSTEFLKAHIQVQNMQYSSHPDCSRHVVGLIFFSDGTSLSTFGDAHFWPAYLQLANDTKYDRISPSSHLTEHIAYFQKLPAGKFKAFLRQHDDRKSISVLLTHCKRELFQAQWEILLDEDFLNAYKDGLLVKCFDGVQRLFFPRIFVYCADYPEKVLLATIKSLSDYPCPRCLVSMEDVPNLGTVEDMTTRSFNSRIDNNRRRKQIRTARNLVYAWPGRSLQSKALKQYLDVGSYTITESAFSKKLGPLGFNFFSMFRTEILHEWSSNGEGKKLHQHLLRILDTMPQMLSMLDFRYSDTPSFGTDIRKFRANVSDASFQAAHDVDQIINCAIPVYENLLPEPHNSRVLDMLYLMSEWHILAKLRLHTDHTLHLLDESVKELGAAIRDFVELTCTQFKTMELKHEAAKRLRHTAKLAQAKAKDSSKSSESTGNSGSHSGGQQSENSGNRIDISAEEIIRSRLETKVNIHSSKFHALGDVARCIREVGSTDSYTAEIGEGEHRTSKRRYPRTDGREYTKQLTEHDRREARLRQISDQIGSESLSQGSSLPPSGTDFLSKSDLTVHHDIGTSQNNSVKLANFMVKNSGDPAVRDFLRRLKQHLLIRLKSMPNVSEKPDQLSTELAISLPDNNEYLRVVFQNSETMYSHNIFRVNYTSYDVRRQRDVLNPNTDNRDIMVLSSTEDGPRFYYARILGVYHCNVKYHSPLTSDTSFSRLEFLWVRWFRTVEDEPRRLECLEFVPFEEEGCVGFLDPEDVIRGVHIIPRFAKGLIHPDRKGRSRVCHDGSDYCQYNVGRFSNGDLYMRSKWGLGVGHHYSHIDAPTATPPLPDYHVSFSGNDDESCDGDNNFMAEDFAISSDEEEPQQNRNKDGDRDLHVSDSEHEGSDIEGGYEDTEDNETFWARFG